MGLSLDSIIVLYFSRLTQLSHQMVLKQGQIESY